MTDQRNWKHWVDIQGYVKVFKDIQGNSNLFRHGRQSFKFNFEISSIFEIIQTASLVQTTGNSKPGEKTYCFRCELVFLCVIVCARYGMLQCCLCFSVPDPQRLLHRHPCRWNQPGTPPLRRPLVLKEQTPLSAPDPNDSITKTSHNGIHWMHSAPLNWISPSITLPCGWTHHLRFRSCNTCF